MLSSILSRYWWTTLLRGLVWILFGIAVLLQPGISLVTFTLLGAARITERRRHLTVIA
jgi:uncharacterized membrane protein HdeD (DUF308 family)